MIEIFSWNFIDIYLEQAIVGRVIRALQKCFHPDCFRCQLCQTSLLEIGFSKYNDKFVSWKEYFYCKIADENL